MRNDAMTAERERLLALALARKGIVRQTRDAIRAHGATGECVLSYPQQRLWFLEKLHPGSSAYNVPVSMRVPRGLDVEVLRRSLAEIVRRHAILRTTFVERDGEPRQVVHATMEVPVPVHELGHLDATARSEEVGRRAAAHLDALFDLATGPLLRLTVFACGDDGHVLLFCAHHIVADAWSVRVLMDELAALYRAYATGAESPLPELGLQYSDFAQWQREALAGDALDAQVGYWKGKLGDAPAPLALPIDRPRRARRSQAGASVAVELPLALRSALRAFAREVSATMFMVCLAGFKALLARTGGQSDIVVGTPVWNRDREELEPLIGFFVNTLALRTDVADDAGFRAAVKAVRETVLDAFANQDLPFEKLVEELGVARVADETPLIRAMFSLVGEQDVPAPDGGAFLEAIDVSPTTAKFDLTLMAIEHAGGLRVELQYSTELFDRTTVERLAAQYAQLLEAAVAQPAVPLSRLPLLDAAGQAQVAAWGEGLAAEWPTGDVVSWFAQQAARAPQALAVSDGARSLDYATLAAQAAHVACVLRSRGVGAGSVVALGMERSVEFVVAMLAVAQAGAAWLPLDVGHPAERLAWIVTDAQAALVLTREADGLAFEGVPTLTVEAALADVGGAVSSLSALPQSQANDPQALAYVIYTSGSTGRPKGVEVAHAALANVVAWHAQALGIEAGTRTAQLAGAAFDASLLEWWGALVRGASIHIVAEAVRAAPAALIHWLASEAIEVAFLPTPLAEASWSERWPASLALRAIYVGGDALRRVPPAGLPFAVFNDYGPTEAAVVSTCEKILPGQASEPGIGRPIPGTRVRVVDAAGQAVPVGVVGELQIAGAGLARGYRGRPDLSEERFFVEHGTRWYRSGDRARWKADGTLAFVGRQDDQVKLRGYRIELGEVQAALHAIDGVRNAIVRVYGEDADRRLVAYLEADALTAEAVQAQLGRWLPTYMVPSTVRVLEALPLDRNGKIDTAALRQLEQAEAAVAYVAPVTDSERLLAQVWAEVLGIERVGIHDNFFALGGHSLLAIRVVARVGKALGEELPLQSLFEEPTVAGLALGIDARRWVAHGGGAPAIAVLPRSGQATDVYTQSHAQQRMWFLHQMDPAAATYNVHGVHALRGPLDVAALEEALNALVRRHESLRTTFEMERDGRLIQIVARDAHVALPLTRLDSLAPADAQAQARRIVEEEAARPFDLGNGPLLRVMLLRFGPDRHALSIGMHHIITDGWSMEVFLRELSALYRQYSGGHPAELAPLPVQYADFADWHGDWMNFGLLEELLFYWQEHLRDAPVALALPTDRPRSRAASPRGDVVAFSLGRQGAQRAQQFANASNATPFMVLLAAFKALLARVSDKADIVLGVPVANRMQEELEPLIGFFVNTLALRTDLSGDPGFADVVARVRATAVAGFAHQNLPMERLLERLDQSRRWQRAPLFQAMFVLQNAPMAPLQLEGVAVEPMPVATRTTKFDLTLSLQEIDGELHGVFEYSTDLFDRDTVERLAAQYARLLEVAVAQPAVPLSQLPLLDAAGQAQVAAWGRGPAADLPPGDVVAWFAAHAARAPLALAVTDGVRSLDYATLATQATHVAGVLRARGIGPGSVVALGLERSVEFVVAMLAVAQACAAWLPLDVGHPADRLAWIVADAQAALVLTRDADGLAVDTVPTLTIESALAQPAAPVTHVADLQALAYVIYTSGSTGRPKGVEVTHAALANVVAWHAQTLGIVAGTRTAQLAGAAFDASLLEWWGALAQGASVHIVGDAVRAAPATLVNWLAGEAIEVAFLPTPLAEATWAERWPADLALRAIFVGGDALRRVPPAGLPFVVFNDYGPTEASVVSTCEQVMPGQADEPGIGTPIAGTQVRVVDAAGQAVPVGVVGELQIAGAGLARGYRGRPDLTAERFVDDAGTRWYRTGDRARWKADGTLAFVGRQDDQIKLRGFRIELGEVQAALAALDGVRQVYVLVREDVPGDRRLTAYVVPSDAAVAPAPADLLAALRTTLPDYMVPAALVVVDALPLNASGKVNRSALARPAAERYAGGGEVVPARTDLESALVGMWEVLLDYRPAGINHNFFMHGGHSLNALRLRAQVLTDYGVEFDLQFLFENGTIEQLAREIERLRAIGPEASGSLSVAAARAPVAAVPAPGAFRRWLGRLGGWGKTARKSEIGPDPVAAARHLVSMESRATGTPLFCIHPIGGGVLCYAELAALLGRDQPVYGLQAGDGGEALPTSIEELARRYIRALRVAQPHGPYSLCGWSLGGVIAYEMAQQLHASGDEVGLLCLLDTYPFDGRRDVAELGDAEMLDGLVKDLAMSAGKVLSVDWLASVDFGTELDPQRQALTALKSLELVPADYGNDAFARLRSVYEAGQRAWSRYEPRPYAGHLHLAVCLDSIEGGQRSPTGSWGHVATGGFTVEVVPGDHYAMLRGAAVRQVATHLAQQRGSDAPQAQGEAAHEDALS